MRSRSFYEVKYWHTFLPLNTIGNIILYLKLSVGIVVAVIKMVN